MRDQPISVLVADFEFNTQREDPGVVFRCKRGYQMKNQSSNRPNINLRLAIRAALALPVAVVIAPAPALSQESSGLEQWHEW